MTYEEIYAMNIEDLIDYWNKWCVSHERRELRIYTMAEWTFENGEGFVVSPLINPVKE